MRRKTVAEFIDLMKGLTPQDVTKLVTKALKSPPSIASLGNISDVPRYDAIARKFN